MVIGIAGGIGSGKSTVTKYLMEKGYVVIDADKIAREIVQPGSKLLKVFQKEFGSEVLSNGKLNRKILASIIFSNFEKKKRLDQLTHEEIKEVIKERIRENSNEEYIFLDAPLFFEANLEEFVSKVWIIEASKEVKLKRAMERDNATEKDILKVMSFQMTDMEREEEAKKRGVEYIVIDNSKDVHNLLTNVSKALGN